MATVIHTLCTEEKRNVVGIFRWRYLNRRFFYFNKITLPATHVKRKITAFVEHVIARLYVAKRVSAISDKQTDVLNALLNYYIVQKINGFVSECLRFDDQIRYDNEHSRYNRPKHFRRPSSFNHSGVEQLFHGINARPYIVFSSPIRQFGLEGFCHVL